MVAVTAAPVTAGTNLEIALGKVGRILTFSKNQLAAAQLTTDAYLPIKSTFFMIVLGDVHETFQIDGINPVTRKMKVGKLANSYGTGAKYMSCRKIYPSIRHWSFILRPTAALTTLCSSN